MSTAIAWVKTNLTIVISAVIVVAAVAGLFLGNAQGKGLTDLAGKRKRTISQIDGYKKTQIELPPNNPGDDPITLRLCLNNSAINKLRQLYERMTGEYTAIFDDAVKVNQGSRTPMMAELFPQFSTAAIPFKAKKAYRRAFKTMLGPYSPKSKYPNLNSGMPPDMYQQGELEQELTALTDDFLARNDLGELNELVDEEQNKALRQQLEGHVIQRLTEKARSIHVYATQPLPDTGSVIEFPEDIAFDIDDWSGYEVATPNQPDVRPPTVDDIWEGQIGLWIQQDIVKAIALVNQVEDSSANVMTAPVKHLMLIEITEGYIGIDTKGELFGSGPTGGMGMGMGRGGDPGLMMDDDMHMMGGGGRRMLMPGQEYEPVTATDGDTPLDEDFSVSHTGRRSNAIYDVRHVSVTLRIDSQRLTEFFEALSKVNFMTVLRVNMTDVDEYEALAEGFVYGNADVVELEVLIETIWLRDWTSQYMPNRIKSQLGILREGDEGYVNPFELPGMRGGPGMDPMEPF